MTTMPTGTVESPNPQLHEGHVRRMPSHCLYSSMNPSIDVSGAAEASPFITPHEKNTGMPLLESLRHSKQDFLFDTPSTHILHMGDRWPGDPLMDTPECATIQLHQLRCTVDSQEDLLLAILQKSGMVEDIVHALDNRVAKLEVGPLVTVQEMSHVLDEKVTRIKKAIAQTSQHDSICTLHDKVTALELSLRYHKEKCAKYEERCGRMDA
jgi:hypothetical protein